MEKLGIIGYDNCGGLGNLIRNFRNNLPIVGQFLINNPMKVEKTMGSSGDSVACIYTPVDMSPTVAQFEEFLETTGVTQVIIIETPFNWEFLRIMHERGIRVVYIPMFDCVSLAEIKYLHFVDLWVALNKFSYVLLIAQGFKSKSVYLPYALNLSEYPYKERGGQVFAHNAGYHKLPGSIMDAHKGTDIVVRTMQLPEFSAYTLILNSLTDVPMAAGTPNIKINKCLHHTMAELYAEGDIYLAPSRWEGLSLPLYEAMASGFIVLTTNAPPMNQIIQEASCLVSCERFPLPHGTGTGYVCTIPALSRCMDGILKRNDRAEISHRNREFMEKMHSWDTVKVEYYKAFGI